jgi:hypothetical protein
MNNQAVAVVLAAAAISIAFLTNGQVIFTYSKAAIV